MQGAAMHNRISDFLLIIGLILFVAVLIMLGRSYSFIMPEKYKGRLYNTAADFENNRLKLVLYSSDEADIGKHLAKIIKEKHYAGEDVEKEVLALQLHAAKTKKDFEDYGINKEKVHAALIDGWTNKAKLLLEKARQKCSACDVEKEIQEFLLTSQKLERLNIDLEALGTSLDEIFDILLEGFYQEAIGYLSMSASSEDALNKKMYLELGLLFFNKYFEIDKIRLKGQFLKHLPLSPEAPFWQNSNFQNFSTSGAAGGF